MAKKQKGFSDAATSQVAAMPRIRIGILRAKFMHCKQYSPNVSLKNIKCWPAGTIVWNEDDLDELLAENAPIEVYYKDVDRPTES